MCLTIHGLLLTDWRCTHPPTHTHARTHARTHTHTRTHSHTHTRTHSLSLTHRVKVSPIYPHPLMGEYMIKAGTLGLKLYFVQSGVVDVLTEDRELMTSLSDGSHFGGLCVCVHVRTIFIIFGCTIKSTQMRVRVATCFAAESATGTSPVSCRCGLGWTNSCICVPLCAPSRNMPVD